MNDAKTDLTLDVRRAEAQGEIRVKLGDNARTIAFSLVSGANAYVPGSGARAYFYAKKPSSPATVVYNECALSGSTATYGLTGGTTDTVGTLECEIRIVDAASGKLLTSPRFRMFVDDVVYDDGAVEAAAETELGVLDELVGDSEAWAVGERDGVPVGPSDETYHNNSKYYAEQAASSAADAGENAEAWAVGTRDGEPVSSDDPAYHNNAKWYKDQAAGYRDVTANYAAAAAAAVPTVYGETGVTVRVVYCTQEQYNAMSTHDNNTDYRIYEE